MGVAARAWSLENVPTWRQVFTEDLLPIWRRANSHHQIDDARSLPGRSGPA